MSWDIVSKAVETVITNAILGIGRLAPLLPTSPAPDVELDGGRVRLPRRRRVDRVILRRRLQVRAPLRQGP